MKFNIGKSEVLPPLLALASLLLFPAPSSPAESSPGESAPRWGLAARAGHYGLPDWLLDLLFEEHPSVDGTIFGAEIRHYGENGPSGTFSLGLTFDIGRTDGLGTWQEDAGSTPVVGGGEVDIAMATLTAYWDLWPSSTVHPYIGLGLGAGYADGKYVRDGEEVNVSEFVPVVHIPAGLVLSLGDNLAVALEGRIIDGVSWGGLLQLRF